MSSRLLLIEPDRVLAATYKRALTADREYMVMKANGAQAAVRLADIKTPDLVILELQLIAHSGIEFLYEFRSYSEWQNIPVIVHSMVPFAEFRHSWELMTHELGVVSYLYKPDTSLAHLVEAVREYVPVKT